MVDYNNPNLLVTPNKVRSGKIEWRSPSNIALIKYWGKYGQQLPCNPSISFTLDAAYTETTLEYGPKMTDKPGVSVDFLFHNQHNKPFSDKIERYLTSLLPIYPFLSQIELTIFSSNSFPHSAGIASSAAAMSALALCLCSLEDELFGTLSDDKQFDQKASFSPDLVLEVPAGPFIRKLPSGVKRRKHRNHQTFMRLDGDIIYTRFLRHFMMTSLS